jgi:hypothetical protein
MSAIVARIGDTHKLRVRKMRYVVNVEAGAACRCYHAS